MGRSNDLARTRAPRAGLAFLLATAGMALPGAALASEPAATLLERAEAELETQSFAEACPLLLRSYEADPVPGTLARAAECLEQAGRLAAAHATYTRLLALPEGALSPTAQARARSRHAELGPRLSRVSLRLPAELRAVVGLRVTIDGEPVPRAEWDLPRPRDGGPVTVTVTTPEQLTFTASAVLAREGADHVLDLPSPAGLSARQVRAPTRQVFVRAPSPLEDAALGRTQLAGACIFAVGAAALGTGVVLGVLAKADHNRAATLCTDNRCADPALVLAAESARTKGDVGTVVGLAGAALMTGGAALVLFAPSTKAPSRVAFGPLGLGLAARGTFE